MLTENIKTKKNHYRLVDSISENKVSITSDATNRHYVVINEKPQIIQEFNENFLVGFTSKVMTEDIVTQWINKFSSLWVGCLGHKK